MTDEAKLIIAGLRYCTTHDLCTKCPSEEICRFSDTLIETKGADLIEAMCAELEQVKRERDVAVYDLTQLAMGFGDECHSCRFCEWDGSGTVGKCKRAEIIAEETGEEVEGGTIICIWEWRGPKEESPNE